MEMNIRNVRLIAVFSFLLAGVAMYGVYQKAYHEAFEQGVKNGTQKAFQQQSALWNKGDATFIFRTNGVLNKSVAVAFPEQNISYVCSINRENELQTGNWTYQYRKADCQVINGDLESAWDDPEFNNTLVGNRVVVNNSESSS